MQLRRREFSTSVACVFEGVFSPRVARGHDPTLLIEKRGACRRTAEVESEDEDFGRPLHLFEFREQSRPAL